MFDIAAGGKNGVQAATSAVVAKATKAVTKLAAARASAVAGKLLGGAACIPPAQAQMLFDKADDDGNGFLSLHEFRTVLLYMRLDCEFAESIFSRAVVAGAKLSLRAGTLDEDTDQSSPGAEVEGADSSTVSPDADQRDSGIEGGDAPAGAAARGDVHPDRA